MITIYQDLNFKDSRRQIGILIIFQSLEKVFQVFSIGWFGVAKAKTSET